jgi:hypothetical protein
MRRSSKCLIFLAALGTLTLACYAPPESDATPAPPK